MTDPKPTIPEVLPLARAIYARPGGSVGCCLHVVLDDGNTMDDHVRYCLEFARERGHDDCAQLAGLLLRMSRTQRSKIAGKIYER